MGKNEFDHDGSRQDSLLNNHDVKGCQEEDGLIRDNLRDTHGKECSEEENSGEENHEKDDSRDKDSREECFVEGWN